MQIHANYSAGDNQLQRLNICVRQKKPLPPPPSPPHTPKKRGGVEEGGEEKERETKKTLDKKKKTKKDKKKKKKKKQNTLKRPRSLSVCQRLEAINEVQMLIILTAICASIGTI